MAMIRHASISVVLLSLSLSLLAGCDSSAGENDAARPSDLWRFAALGKVQGIQQLVDQGVDLDALDPIYDSTALELASCYGQIGVLEVLIEAGANVNARSGAEGTPVLSAAFFGRPRCLELLLKHGGDPVVVNQDGVNPMYATYIDRGLTQAVADFLQMTIDLEAVDRGREECRLILGPYFPGFIPPAFQQKGAGSQELFEAIAFGDIRNLKALIDSGADLAVRDQFGTTPLGAAAFLGRSKCLSALLAAGADPREPNSDGSTPMQMIDQVPWSMTKEVADSFGIPLDKRSFEEGRASCRTQLREALQ